MSAMGKKSIQVSEAFHSYVEAHKKEGETLGETLVRLTGGPRPEVVAGLVSEETADAMEEAIEARSQNQTTSREQVVEQFKAAADS
jgi:hypothetical protein